MTTTNIARMQDAARMNAPGALDGVIRKVTFDTLQEFFQRSDCWLLEIPVPITGSTNDYELSTGQNANVIRLMSLEYPATPPAGGQWPPPYLPMCPPQYMAVSTDSPHISESQNPAFRVPKAGVLLNAGTKCPILRITTNPQADQLWIALLSLNVCDPMDGDGLPTPPDWITEKWRQYIESGIICKLMLQPGKPYSSVQGAQYHGRKFNEGVGLARTETRHMFTYGSQRWGFPARGWNAQRPRLPSGQVI